MPAEPNAAIEVYNAKKLINEKIDHMDYSNLNVDESKLN